MNITKDTYDKTAKRAVKIYGAEQQLDQTIEEMAELTKALIKYKRTLKDRCPDNALLEQCIFNIADEMADVEIMFKQLRYILPTVDDLIVDRKLFKINRFNSIMDDKEIILKDEGDF